MYDEMMADATRLITWYEVTPSGLVQCVSVQMVATLGGYWLTAFWACDGSHVWGTVQEKRRDDLCSHDSPSRRGRGLCTEDPALRVGAACGCRCAAPFADYCAIDAVNWSSLKHLWAGSPLHYKHHRESADKDTTGRKMGRLLHAMALGSFDEEFVVFEDGDRRGKVWSVPGCECWPHDSQAERGCRRAGASRCRSRAP